MRLPLRFLEYAGAIYVLFRSTAQPYFGTRDRGGDAACKSHFRTENVVDSNLDRADVNSRSHLKFGRTRMGLQRPRVAEGRFNRPENRHNAVADCFHLVSGVLGKQGRTLGKMLTAHLAHCSIAEFDV